MGGPGGSGERDLAGGCSGAAAQRLRDGVPCPVLCASAPWVGVQPFVPASVRRGGRRTRDEQGPAKKQSDIWADSPKDWPSQPSEGLKTPDFYPFSVGRKRGRFQQRNSTGKRAQEWCVVDAVAEIGGKAVFPLKIAPK